MKIFIPRFYAPLTSLMFLMPLCIGCGGTKEKVTSDSLVEKTGSEVIEGKDSGFAAGNTICTRYKVPDGFHRVVTEKGSFEEFLQTLPLKPEGYVTHTYDGTEKKKKIATSVIDLDIDTLNFRNNAEVIIRLRAEYLYRTKQFDKIHFTFTNNFDCDYLK